MAHKVFMSSAAPILEIQYLGTVSPQNLRASIDDAFALAFTTQCSLFLTDCSQMTGGHSLVDLYEQAKRVSELRPPAGFREAIILPENQTMRELVGFWATAGSNRGLAIRTFSTREAAMTWLREID